MHLNRNVNFIVNFIMLSITLAFVLLEIWSTVLHFWNNQVFWFTIIWIYSYVYIICPNLWSKMAPLYIFYRLMSVM